MTTTGKKPKLLLIIALPFALLIILMLIINWSAKPYISVAGVNGVWDLRDIDFTDGNVKFTGYSLFIPNALLTPSTFAEREHEAITAYPRNEDFLTNRFTILVPTDGWYTLSHPTLFYSARIYVNGEYMLSIGSPGYSRESNIPDTRRITFTVMPVDGVIEIIQQSSNFVHRQGGWQHEWTIGQGTDLFAQGRVADFHDTIIMGSFFALFISLLIFAYILKAQDRGIIYCALFCLVWFFRIGLINRSVFTELIPWMDWYTKFRLEYITVPVSAILAVAIVPTLFPNVLHKYFYRAFFTAMTVLVGFYLFGGTVFISYVKLVSYGIYGVTIIFMLACFAVKVRRLSASQLFFFAGMLSYMISTVFDIFYFTEIAFTVHFSGFAMLVFALCKATAVFIITVKSFEEAKEAEERLAYENTALERVNRLRTEMIATITHEARTPLAVLASYASLVSLELQQINAAQTMTADLDKIAFEASRVANLIDHLRDVTKQSEGAAQKVAVDIKAMVEQTAKLYSHILERDGVALLIHSPDALPPAFGNPEALAQVFFNLLQNAKNHTQSGSVSVSLTVVDGKLQIKIADTGMGIPPDLLPHVFQYGVSGNENGTGIGLAVCKEIIQAHQGEIIIESEQGKGTVVTIDLPIHE